LFEEQAASTPDQIALVGKAQSAERRAQSKTCHAPCAVRHALSYKELNEQSNQLACLLIEKGVKPDTIVGLMMERSIEMIIGIMAILKAGGAYLPIAANFPEERVEYMLADSGAKVLLTNLPEGHHSINCQLSIVNCQLLMNAAPNSLSHPTHLTHPTHLSYVIYTSGTTGRPKGTLTTHRNVIRVVKNTNYIRLTGEDRVLQLSNYAFDGSVFDIYGALLNGAALVLVEKGKVSDVDALGELIDREKITVFFVTTALFNTLVDLELECLRNVRNVLFGGERVSVAHTRRALEFLGKDKVIHMYGPTETTVYASYYIVNKIDETLGTVPIGKPISNTSIYILDKALKPTPIGVTGEIYIGGPGVARGYLNRPELTAERFPPAGGPTHPTHPLTHSPNYRTGDLARWLPNPAARGAYIIEFLGRKDHQVKIRGFRIELGEIENRLLKHHEIKEAVVVVKEEKGVNQTYLCGYIVSTREFSTSELREYLSCDLPDYMIPSYFVQLEKIPLNPNGKLDRKSLPVPGFKAGETYAAPRNEKEAVLVEIWAGVLGVEKDRIGIDADFFDLGGHSLKATSLVSRVHKELNIKIPLEEIIRGLSRYITKAVAETFAPIEPVEKKEYYPLSAAQRRLYIMQQLKMDYVSYNQSMAVVLEGNVEKEKLQEVFRNLIRRHESLRTSFEIIEKEPIQRIHPDVEFEVEAFDRDFIRPFDLSRPPLLRVGLAKLEERKHILMVDMHHIISDGTSMTIFIGEFTALHEGKELPELCIRYKQFKGDIPRLNLPFDYPENRDQDFEGAAVAFEIEKELAIKTKALMQETGTTWYMLILAVYNILLSKYTGQEDIVVGSGIAGRRHVDLNHVIGMFVNMLAMRNRPEENKTFTKFLEEVKENALHAYENQDYPFDQLVETLAVERESGRNPLFDTQFTFQNLLEQPGEGLPEVEIKDFKIKPYENGKDGLKMQFDLSLNGVEVGDTVHMSFQYVTALFKESTIREMTKHTLDILEQVVENRNMELKEINISHELAVGESILSEEESMDYEF
jgi:amino acid adenylation domain-containing protein